MSDSIPEPLDKVEWVIDPDETALLVIDMQKDFVDPDAPMFVPMNRDILPNLRELVEASRSAGMEVIYTQHVHDPSGKDMGLMDDFWEPIRTQEGLVDGTEGVEVHEKLAPKEDELQIKKHRYSAFYNTDLDLELRNRGIETLIITGCVTNQCCESTARSAQFRDYEPIFVSDGTAQNDAGEMSAEDLRASVCTSLSQCIAEVASTESVVDRIEAATREKRAEVADD